MAHGSANRIRTLMSTSTNRVNYTIRGGMFFINRSVISFLLPPSGILSNYFL